MWAKFYNWIKHHDHVVLGRSRCVLCHAVALGAHALCGRCEAALPRIHTACLRCGIPLPISSVCGPCQIRPPPYDRAVAAMEYGAVPRWLIQRFKFHGHLPYGRVLSGLMVARLQRESAPLPELLLPVPLHPARWRTRGFNQAEELARDIGRELHIPVVSDVLARVVATRDQAGLAARERRRNVTSAFAITRPLAARSVAIIDDVMTTGSTVGALAQVLRAAGVEHIGVWVAARAVLGQTTPSSHRRENEHDAAWLWLS